MPTTEQRNQQRNPTGKGKPRDIEDINLLASALRFGGELTGLVDEDLATRIFGMSDAPGFDAKTHASEHDWFWIESSTKKAVFRMATKLREAMKGTLN